MVSDCQYVYANIFSPAKLSHAPRLVQDDDNGDDDGDDDGSDDCDKMGKIRKSKFPRIVKKSFKIKEST